MALAFEGLGALLRELDVGSWSGLTRDEIEREHPGAVDRYRAGIAGWTPCVTIVNRWFSAKLGMALGFASAIVRGVTHASSGGRRMMLGRSSGPSCLILRIHRHA